MRYVRRFGDADINPFHCFYLLQKMLIYDTILPTPHGKSRIMVVGGGEKQGKVAPPPWVRPYAHIKRNAYQMYFIGLKTVKHVRNGNSAPRSGKK